MKLNYIASRFFVLIAIVFGAFFLAPMIEKIRLARVAFFETPQQSLQSTKTSRNITFEANSDCEIIIAEEVLSELEFIHLKRWIEECQKISN